MPEVEVGAVRLVSELAQLRVALALGDGDRVRRLLVLGGGWTVVGWRVKRRAGS